MNNLDQHPEIWNDIDRYLAGAMPEPERKAFEQLMERDEEVAEMVAFSESMQLREAYRQLGDSEADELRRDALLGRVAGNPRLARTLAWEQQLQLAARREQLLGLMNSIDSAPHADPEPAPRRWIDRPLVKAGLVAATLLVLLISSYFVFQPQLSTPTPFPEVPDYPYDVLNDGFIGEKAPYDAGDYDRAEQLFSQLYEQVSTSEEQDGELLENLKFYLALIDIRQGDYAQARRLLEEVIDNKNRLPNGQDINLPGQPEELFLGLLYYRQGDYARAREWLRRAAGSTGNLKGGVPVAEVAQEYLAKLPDS